jgi:hypothetical protein
MDREMESNMSLNMSPKQNGHRFGARKLLILKVGTAGFEPTASCTPSKRATRLRHVPYSYLLSISDVETGYFLTSPLRVVNKSSAISFNRLMVSRERRDI